MTRDLTPEDVLKSLEKEKLSPFYLFYGSGEFRLEKVLTRIREGYLAESARDFNLEIFYGGEDRPSLIIDHAQSLPFLAGNRLIIVRRTEAFKAGELDLFLPYLDHPSDTTCLIFVSFKTDFKRRFYKQIRSAGQAVLFGELKGNEIVHWIRSAAGELDLNLDGQAAGYLQQIIGNRLRDINGELEKLKLRYGDQRVGLEEVQELAVHSRIYSIFELMNMISSRKKRESLEVLTRFLDEEDKKDAPLRVIGMINRQLRLLWKTKAALSAGRKTRDIAQELGLPFFSAGHFVTQSKLWSEKDLKAGIGLLYQADRRLKSGTRSKPVLENLIIALTGSG